MDVVFADDHQSGSAPSGLSAITTFVNAIYAMDLIAECVYNAEANKSETASTSLSLATASASSTSSDNSETATETETWYFRTTTITSSTYPSFYCDILCLLPWYIILLLTTVLNDNPTLQATLLTLSRLPQLHRIRLLKSFFRSMEVAVEFDVRKTALLKYITLIMGSAHWLGCIWWALSKFNEHGESTWVYT